MTVPNCGFQRTWVFCQDLSISSGESKERCFVTLECPLTEVLQYIYGVVGKMHRHVIIYLWVVCW